MSSIPQMQIPEKFREGFSAMYDLKDTDIERLIVALTSISPILNPKSLASQVAAKIDSLERSTIDNIIDALASLYTFEFQTNFSVPEIIQAICNAMENASIGTRHISIENRNWFEERLYKLLNIDSLKVTAKALIIMREHENVFGEAKIITDIRSIFGSNPEDPPVGAAVSHVFKIEYYHNNESQEFFLGMDTSDINSLIEVLKKATQKAEILKAVIQKAGLTYIEVE